MDRTTPKNLQELLKFAIKQQQGDECSQNVQLDEEKKQFLEQVLQNMSVDITQEFLKAINTLQHSSNDEEIAEALDLIRDYIYDIDFANGFIKIEGADILTKYIEHTNQEICRNAINVVAEMCRNNEVCQKYFHSQNLVQILTDRLSNQDQNVVASALCALSALIHHYLPALTDFIQIGGIRATVNCLNLEHSPVLLKACSLIMAMCSEFTLVQDEFAKQEVVNKLIKKARVVDSFDAEIEMVLRALSVLIESRQCKLSEAELKYITETLETMQKNNANLPECEEIVKFSKSILERLDSLE